MATVMPASVRYDVVYDGGEQQLVNVSWWRQTSSLGKTRKVVMVGGWRKLGKHMVVGRNSKLLSVIRFLYVFVLQWHCCTFALKSRRYTSHRLSSVLG